MTAECSALIRRKRQLSCFIFHPPESISLRGGHRLVQATLPHIIHLNPAAAVFINTMGIIFLFQRGFNRSFFNFFSSKLGGYVPQRGRRSWLSAWSVTTVLQIIFLLSSRDGLFSPVLELQDCL